ncbi:hypothetical protein I204_05161 [Kwoniella mangroviensis CBS 8886]|nr:hypothetical protein I204_05161 [Kwoniella mangroviensis CBS 8886]
MPSPSEGSSSSLAPSAEGSSSSVTVAGPSRTIHSFFGGSSSTAATGFSAPSNGNNSTTRKRKKKDENNQAKLSLNGSENGVGWVMGKPEEDKQAEAKRSNGNRRNSGGEEEEMKDMAGKNKAKRSTRGKRKSDVHGITSEGDADGICLQDVDDNSLIDPSLFASTSQEQTPPKKKGRSRKSRVPTTTITTRTGSALNAANSSSFDYPSAASSSSSSSIFPALTGHRHSVDFEVTGQSYPIKGKIANDVIEIDQNSSPDRPILVSSSTSPIKIGVGPKKISFAADKKPQHSFFSRLNVNPDPNSGENGTTDGNRSRASSINSVNTALSGEEPKDTGKSKEKDKKKIVHGFFKNVSMASEGVSKNGWGNGIKEGEELIAPLPRGEWPNHFSPTDPDIQYPAFVQNQEAGPSRKKRPFRKEVMDDGFWYSVLENADSVSSGSRQNMKDQETFSIAPYILQHPAFTSIPSKSAIKSTSNRDSWTDRYRPLCAAEVLSNEVEATYLKDWLSALSVGQAHRKVIRKVKRALKSNLINGWIVDDLALFGDHPAVDHEEEEKEEIELEELDDPPISPDPDHRPESYPNLNGRLTNTILLTGRHGSGKSAAVYAAAHELGWDVFEVFAGMGKRTSANLLSWVGDVGKNHMVSQEKKLTPKKEKGGSAPGALKSFFGKAKAKPDTKLEMASGSQGSAHEPIDIDQDDDETPDEVDEVQILGNSNGTGSDGKIRQSLILIDEADILFDEESTFWPAVISIISESRRPVIITCNDHNLIPKSQLPLQAILQFRPSPSYIALPYLQAIALHEAKHSHRPLSNVQETFEQSIHQERDILDIALPPNGNERIPYFDLRKAIGQLQLDRSRSSPSNGFNQLNQEKGEDDLALLVKKLELISYVDAQISQKGWMQLEVSEVDRHYRTTDDQLGIHALIKPEIDESYPVLAGYDYCSTISDTLISMGAGEVKDTGNLALDRMRYIRSTLPILDPLIPLSSPLLPHSSLFLHTLPAILNIVETDDILKAAEEDAVRRGEERINRKTGRPVRGGQGYTRWLADLDEGAEEVARGLIVSGISTGKPSGKFTISGADGSTTTVNYQHAGNDRYSYTVKSGNSGRSSAPVSLDRLYGGNKLEYSIYRSIMGDKAKPPPEDEMFSYTATSGDGTPEERNVRLTADRSEDGIVTYGISESARSESWSTGGQSLDDIRSGKFGKAFTAAFNKYLESRGGGDITSGTGDTASQDTLIPVPTPTSVA